MSKRMKCSNRIKTKMFANTVREYCSNTTVHGIRYLSEENLSWIERLWWFLSIVVLIVLCLFATLNIWSGWQKRPVIVSFDDKTTSIGTIPFPAVTICSSQIIDKNKFNVKVLIDEFTYKPDFNLTSDEVCKFDALLHLCSTYLIEKIRQITTAPPCESIYEAIESIGPASYITISRAQLDQREVFLRPIYTDRGLCFTFNSLNSKDIYSDEVSSELFTVHGNPDAHWNIEDGYAEGFHGKEMYPKRVTGTKAHEVLMLDIGLWSEKNQYVCSYQSDKFYVALHSPDELPRTREDFMLIQINQEFHVTVSPVLMKTSNGLRWYLPETRNCFFRAERKLRFFRAYSRNHCELECLANYTQIACNCMPFYLPRDHATRVCSIYDFDCFKKADDDFAKSLGVEKCDCLPECSSLKYDSVSSQANLYDDGNIDNVRTISYTKLDILFKQSNFIGLTRSETSTMTDFVASFGGLLGLFMGVSILSVVELIYYFTLRIFFKIRRERQNQIEPVASRVQILTPANTIIRGSIRRNFTRNINFY